MLLSSRRGIQKRLFCSSSIQRAAKNSKIPSCNTLVEYLKYAKEAQVNPNSMVFRGTIYEFLVKRAFTEALNIKKFNHVAGAFDQGIDLKGRLDLKNFQILDPTEICKQSVQGRKVNPILMSKDTNITVLIQCKHYNKKITAAEIRQMNGIFHYNANRRKNRHLLLLTSTHSLTKQGLEHFLVMEIPMIYCQIKAFEPQSGGDPYEILSYDGGEFVKFFPNTYCKALLYGSNMVESVEKNLTVE